MSQVQPNMNAQEEYLFMLMINMRCLSRKPVFINICVLSIDRYHMFLINVNETIIQNCLITVRVSKVSTRDQKITGAMYIIEFTTTRVYFHI